MASTSRFLKEGGILDLLLWGKLKNDLGDDEKFMVFPISRYRNILNRPKVINEDESISTTANGEFHLVTTVVEDVDDDVIYDLYNQTW